MRPRDVEREIRRSLRTKQNLCILGAPGIGKTELCAGVAADEKVGFKRIVLPQYEEVDLRGIPEVNDRKQTVFYPTSELPYAEVDGEEGVLLLDEHPSAKPAVQVICHQLLDSRKLGSLYKLPPGWTMVATGNRQEDYAFVFEVPTTVKTRWMELTMEHSFDDWKRWALDSGKIAPEVLAFLNANPGEFVIFTPDKPVKNHALPRTWEYLSRYLADVRSCGETPGLECVVGQVGEAAGNKFHGWFKVWKEVPNIDDIIEGKGAHVPTKMDIQWCVITSIMSKLIAKEKDGNVVSACKNGFAYVNKLSSDIVMAFLNDIMVTRFWASVKKKVVTTPEWVELSKKHAKTIVGDTD